MEGNMNADILGLFFGTYNTATGQAQPQTELTIKKEDLDRSSEIFVGRYIWQNTTGYTIALECQVTIDGVPAQYYGGSNVVSGQAGQVDVPLFRWPGTAKANALGKHTIVVTPGLHKGVMGGQETFEVSLPKTFWFPQKTFTVNLV